ncbi:ribonuclease HII [Gulosibacter sediminis]|uniref:ribonuclease HII n=1 Tax=Gulosibacter sediminis TaxID=1729695 RepID=UPI0024A920FC|nr:ribonuclease HII [Gulosibacter sediminis]
MTAVSPTLEVERVLFADTEFVIGIDEVGRGAIAGPVAVGACAIRDVEAQQGFPEGLRDSKLLTAKARERLAPASAEWAFATAVGWASAAEIDEFGITRCLAAAAVRALGELWQVGVPVDFASVLLDGSHDWLSPALTQPLRVMVQPKADRDCASVAAASVVAKVARDARMRELAAGDEGLAAFGWEKNKGYGSQGHRDAIRALGPSSEHRRSWLGKILDA